MNARGTKGIQYERQLWHGTSWDSVRSINTNGFDRSYCGKHGEKIFSNPYEI